MSELVGTDKTIDIVRSIVKIKYDPDKLIWKPKTHGKFSLASAWEVIRNKGTKHNWWKWVWYKTIPKKISVCTWRAVSNTLPTDEKVRKW